MPHIPRIDFALVTLPVRGAGPWLDLWRTDERRHVTWTVAAGRRQLVVSVER